MGGGSSVMGMVALSRHAATTTPNGRRSAPPAGAGTTCCRSSASSRRRPAISAATSTARTARCRSAAPAGRLGAAVQGGARLRAGAPDPVHRRHERRLPRRLRRGADEQLAGQARLGGDLLSRRRGARARQPDDRQRRRPCTGLVFDGRRVTGVDVLGRRRATKQFSAREVIVSIGGIHSPAFLLRTGIGPARHLREHRHRGARRPARRRRESVEPCHRVPRPAAEPRRAAGRMAAPASDDGVPLFVRARRARRRSTCTSTCSARPRGARSASRSPISPRPCSSRCRAAASRWPGRRGRAALVEFNFTGHDLDLQALHAGLPPRGRSAGAREGARDERRDLPGEVQRPAAPAQPHQRQEQGAERGDRQADRLVPAARRPDLLDTGRPPGRSRRHWSPTTPRSPSTSARTSPARSTRSAPAAWAAPTTATP